MPIGAQHCLSCKNAMPTCRHATPEMSWLPWWHLSWEPGNGETKFAPTVNKTLEPRTIARESPLT